MQASSFIVEEIMRRLMSSCAVAVSMLIVPATVHAAAAEAFPVRPVRLITPYAPGGSSTIVSRVVAAELTELWGYSVIVDNRPGGNTIIGTQAGARATPDGYTWVIANTTFALNEHILKNVPYRFNKDLQPLAKMYNNETILAVHPSVPVNTLKEFIAYGKTVKEGLNHGASGGSGLAELRSAMFRLYTGLDFKNIPYNGSGPAAVAVLGGQVHFTMVPPITVAHYIQQGKIKGLAVTGKKRMPTLPQVPTFAEAGLPKYNVTSWNGLLVPKGTPISLTKRISADIAKVLEKPAVREKLTAMGADPEHAGPEEFGREIQADIDLFATIIKQAGIKQID
jgi:tripartite-type tricarboxylate transporter receptor subunit TctC